MTSQTDEEKDYKKKIIKNLNNEGKKKITETLKDGKKKILKL